MPKGVYPRKPLPLVERFERHVRKAETGCWEWTGGRHRNGYGMFSMRGADGVTRPALAHRVAYEFYREPIPVELVIDHLCRNRGCVNPAHLEAVTMRENLLRGEGVAAKWAARTHCGAGHPLSGENLQVRRGSRECITCVKAQSAASWSRYWERRSS